MDTTNNKESVTVSAEKPEAPRESSEKPTAGATKAMMEEKENARDPVRRITLAAILIAALLFVWYLVADRVAPWTDEARVQAWVIPIAPKVSGIVTHVDVKPDQRVKAGELLAVIDPEEYEIAVEKSRGGAGAGGPGNQCGRCCGEHGPGQVGGGEGSTCRARNPFHPN